MQIDSFEIEGLKLISLKKFSDNRGFFLERFNEKAFKEAGITENWVQDNFSNSKPGVLRGLHYQFDPRQTKLVGCSQGRILDVAVDIRKDSPTFGKYVSVELSGETPQFFYIPAGFAHGFCVLGDQPADLFYKVNDYYNGPGESGIAWSDPELNIDWPTKNLIVSPRDAELPSFASYKEKPHF